VPAVSLLVVIMACLPPTAYALVQDAYFTLIPSSGTVKPGDNFSLSVYTNSTESVYDYATFVFYTGRDPSSGSFILLSADTTGSDFDTFLGSGVITPPPAYQFSCPYVRMQSSQPMVGKKYLAKFIFKVNENAEPGTYFFQQNGGYCLSPGILAPEPVRLDVQDFNGTGAGVYVTISGGTQTTPPASGGSSGSGSALSGTNPKPNSSSQSQSPRTGGVAASSDAAVSSVAGVSPSAPPSGVAGASVQVAKQLKQNHQGGTLLTTNVMALGLLAFLAILYIARQSRQFAFQGKQFLNKFFRK